MGQIVFVTTLNEDETSNIAPKSWISMMVFNPPILALGCNLKHQTAINILNRREFVVNIPGAELAETVWKCSELPHPRPVEAVGLTPIPSVKVKPPRGAECRAHLECTLDRHITYGDEVILLGQILAVEIDKEAWGADDPYSYLRMFVYLDGKKYGVIEQSHQVK
jgi:flavin reductase (DIM6/NTAB) family NADH-FMN oxidoreductase RutF